MDHIEDINSELTTFKSEQSILLRTKEGTRVVLTNQVICYQNLSTFTTKICFDYQRVCRRLLLLRMMKHYLIIFFLIVDWAG